MGIWQNFRIVDCTKASAAVLGTDHPNFLEGQAAAAANSHDLFESELVTVGVAGLALDRLSATHAHYFGGGFERLVGKKLRAFVTERFDFDEKAGMVKAKPKLINVIRKREARDLIDEEHM